LSKRGPSYLKWLINEGDYPDHGKNVTRSWFEIFNQRGSTAVQVNANTKKYPQVAERKWVEVVPSKDITTSRAVWWIDGFEVAAMKYLGSQNPGRTGAAFWFSAFVNREALLEGNLLQKDYCGLTSSHSLGNFPIETLTMWSLTHRDHRQEDTCLARDTGDEDARDYARWSYQESRLCRHKGIHRWQH
jgi:hypothetical protein